MTNRMMMLIGAAILGSGFAGTASALPLAPLREQTGASAHIEAARLICPPYRPCYRVFGGGYGRGYGYGYGRPYGYGRGYGGGYYGRPFYRGYGY